MLIGALAVPVIALLAATAPGPGPLSWHMGFHIASMNIGAPLAAVALVRYAARWRAWSSAGALWLATFAQLGVLWIAHSPHVHHHLQASLMTALALQVVLFLAALAFWTVVVGATHHRWQAMLALLVSGKFACLLGVLLIFAPRALFDVHAAHAMSAPDSALLADQHLAGLLMISACPLSYVLTAVVLAAQTVTSLERPRAITLPRAAVEP